jgi:predicted transglutaminase-like cysteine proteinase
MEISRRILEMAPPFQPLVGIVRLVCSVALLFCMSVAEPASAQELIKVSLRSSVVSSFSIQDEWAALLLSRARFPELSKVQQVNDFFNQHIRFEDDLSAWGQSDYWATPLETLRLGRGDCEDFAIAKYYALKKLGVPADKLRLVYVKAQLNGQFGQIAQAHMVLAYYKTPGADPWVLDSLVNEIRLASNRQDLQPIFSFNTQGLWHGISNRASQSTLSRWQNLVRRAQLEGFE